MRHIRYLVAASVDGYIAGPKGEADWIVADPEVDFGAIWNQFGTILVWRKTFEGMAKVGQTTMPGVKTFVFSRNLRQREYPGVTVVGKNVKQMVTVAAQKAGKGYLAVRWRLVIPELARSRPSRHGETRVYSSAFGQGDPAPSAWCEADKTEVDWRPLVQEDR